MWGEVIEADQLCKNMLYVKYILLTYTHFALFLTFHVCTQPKTLPEPRGSKN